MMTFGELGDAARACRDRVEAEALVHGEAQEILAGRPELTEGEARAIVKNNIGYLTGYGDRDDARRILELFQTEHPFFGPIHRWPQTPEETVAIGKKIGERVRP